MRAWYSLPILALLLGCSSDPATGEDPDAGDVGGDDALDTGSPTEAGADATDSGASDTSGDTGTPTDTAAPADTGVDAPVGPKADIHYIGRFDKNATRARFDWSGSALRTRFVGTGIDVKLAGSANQFQVEIDGAPTAVIKHAGGTVTHSLAKGLTDAEHDLLLVKRTEAFYYPVDFLGFVPTSGKPLVPTAARTRLIEVIGDSITCGYGVLGASVSCSFSADTESAYDAYGSIAARALNAEAVMISWSGIGAYRDNGGKTSEQMPTLWTRTLGTDPAPWSFSYTPDAVIVNLGTNDFAKGDPGKPYETAMTGLVKDIRKRYPKAEIFLALGSMLTDPDLSKARAHLDAVITGLGDAKVSRVELGVQDLAVDGGGCDYHPNVKTQKKMADKLVVALKARLGW
ncbi:MAG: endo-1,4-beta-glucanase [Myxococcales bacterium]|nr:endo-1,4-beta-glucanase [Myxococcales bacterium]